MDLAAVQQDYSKTDGLEYICPKCSHAKYEKPPLPVQVGNGLENTTSAPWNMLISLCYFSPFTPILRDDGVGRE
jgi:hypothetical protein